MRTRRLRPASFAAGAGLLAATLLGGALAGAMPATAASTTGSATGSSGDATTPMSSVDAATSAASTTTGSSATGSSSTRATPASVAVIVPLSLPLDSGSFLAADTLATATAPDGVLTRELDAVADTRVTLAIDPLLIASIRVLGNQAPESAEQWLLRLSSVSNPTFALSYADSDITAPLQAGAARPLEVGQLDFGLDATHFSPASTATPSPTSTPDPGVAPPLPDTEQLLDWRYTQDAVAWPRADTVTNADLPQLAAAGYATVLISSSNAPRAHASLAAANIRGTHVVVTDDVVSGLADRALAATDEESWTTASAALTASVRAYADASENAVVLPRSEALDPSRLREVVDAIEGAASTQIVSLISVSDSATTFAHVVDSPQSDARVALVTRMLLAERADFRFATVADDPDLVRGERRAELLVALSPGADATPGDFADTAQAYLDDSTTLLGSVHVEKPSSIALLADRSAIPISVTNDLDVPVTVLLYVNPSAPLITVETVPVTIHIEANSQKRASVPVQSLSNGNVTLALTLTSRDSVRAGDAVAVTTSVRAGWEGPVTIGLAVFVVLVFAIGLWRAIVTRRRRAAQAAEEDAAESAESAESAEPDASDEPVASDEDDSAADAATPTAEPAATSTPHPTDPDA